jgi:hypothetical protein
VFVSHAADFFEHPELVADAFIALNSRARENMTPEPAAT